MKLIKNNKYTNLKTIGFSIMLFGGMILNGCGKESNIISPIQTELIEVTPMPTPEPTIKPNPILTDEEVIEKFGVLNPSEIVGNNEVTVIEYETNGEYKISFIWISMMPNEFGTYNMYDLFTDDVLFAAEYETCELEFSLWDDSLVKPANENLGDAKFIKLGVIPQLGDYFEEVNIKILTPEDYNIIADDTLEVESTILEYAKLYSNVIPEEYWMTKEILNNTSNLVKVK